MKKILPFILVALLLLGILALILIPAGDDSKRREAGRSKGCSGPITDSTAVSPSKPAITPKQSQDMPRVLSGLKVWSSQYKGSAGAIMNKIFTDRDISDQYLSREIPYTVDFSKGSILHMLGRYLDTLNALEVKDPQDIRVRTELNEFYNGLRTEPDPVAVTIVNRSGGPLAYGDQRIGAGGSLSVTVNSRKLGEVEIEEGAFNFQNQPFVYNPSLLDRPSWDTARYRWQATGKSSYLLEIIK